MPHQANWIQAEEPLHARHERAFILAEKSIRIGWTFCDAFKNVRKRLRFPRRDYLFVTKDYPSALEYILQAYRFAHCDIAWAGGLATEAHLANRCEVGALVC